MLLAPSLLLVDADGDRLVSDNTGARDNERLILDDDRLRAVSIEGLCTTSYGISESPTSRDRDREGSWELLCWSGDRGSSGLSRVLSASAPDPIPQATSSTIAIVHRLGTERSIQPCNTCSAARLIPSGMSKAPA